jgi:hypothetical protein
MENGTHLPVRPVDADVKVAAFLRHLEAERFASRHTISGYLQDLGQLCAFVWGDTVGTDRRAIHGGFGETALPWDARLP